MKIDSEFLLALDELENEKGIKKEIVLEHLKQLLFRRTREILEHRRMRALKLTKTQEI